MQGTVCVLVILQDPDINKAFCMNKDSILIYPILVLIDLLVSID